MAKAIHPVTSTAIHVSPRSSSYGLNKNKANPLTGKLELFDVPHTKY